MFFTTCVNTPGCHCPRAATGPLLACKGAADLPELVCVSSQCSRLGIAGASVAVPLQLRSHFPQQTLSLFHLPDSRFALRAANFLCFSSPALSRQRERFLPDSASLICFSWSDVSLLPKVHCTPQTLTVGQAFRSDPDFNLYSPR